MPSTEQMMSLMDLLHGRVREHFAVDLHVVDAREKNVPDNHGSWPECTACQKQRWRRGLKIHSPLQRPAL